MRGASTCLREARGAARVTTAWARGRARGSSRILRDHEPLDLARALVDRGGLRVAVVALDDRPRIGTLITRDHDEALGRGGARGRPRVRRPSRRAGAHRRPPVAAGHGLGTELFQLAKRERPTGFPEERGCDPLLRAARRPALKHGRRRQHGTRAGRVLRVCAVAPPPGRHPQGHGRHVRCRADRHGVAALLFSRDPAATAAQVKRAIVSSCTPVPQLVGAIGCGGIASAPGALEALGTDCRCGGRGADQEGAWSGARSWIPRIRRAITSRWISLVPS